MRDYDERYIDELRDEITSLRAQFESERDDAREEVERLRGCITKALGILARIDEDATATLAAADYGSEMQEFSDGLCVEIGDAIAILRGER